MISNQTIELVNELSQNFIDFSYEANSQRAFADARDGLKPGQRACLWEMYDKGYTSNKPHVKSAKIEGGVVASWWPHGTTAVYDTFARMSQPWINNIPEVSWHGSNGSIQISGESAASRYTEARLSKETEDGLLYNIKKNNVPMRLNFSEDAEWPEVLPAIIPRLMINGCQGIGSTIANVWLPTDLNELSKVIKKYVEEDILDYTNLYPSFPTGGIIINKDTAQEMYKTGKGKVVLRAKTEIKNNSILITEIPYQVYVEPLIEQIKKLVIDNTITGIDNIINKSDKQKLLIEIECSSSPSIVLTSLFKKTDLQKSYNANQYALVGKTPKLLNLKEYLDVYINHNLTCIIRENEYELKKASDRLEIVEGLIKALEDIDNIINLIKKSDSSKNAVENLIIKYKFTERQAKAIVDMKLGRLAKLEKIELNNEKIELTSIIEKCNNIIKNQSSQKEIFISRLFDFIKKYPTTRKTDVIQINENKNEDKEIENVEPEKCVVVMTEAGTIKRIPAASFKTQRKGGKGVKTSDEITQAVIRTNTIDNLMIFSNKGKMYRLLVNDIPEGTNATKGISIKGLTPMDIDEEPVVMYSVYRDTDAKYVLFITKNGLVKKTSLEEYIGTKKKTGIGAITIKDDDALAVVTLIKDEQLIIITKNGMCIKFDSNEVGSTSRLTSGVKGIALVDDEVIAALPIRDKDDNLGLFSTTGMGKQIKLSDIVLQHRGGKGLCCYKTSPESGPIAAAQLLSDDDIVFIAGSKNNICITAKEIPILSRTCSGNILFKGGKILSATKI